MTLKHYHIWAEGFQTTGESAQAHCLTEKPILATTFNRAVEIFGEQNPNYTIEKNKRSQYMSIEAYWARKSFYNIWGCNLFPDEKSARESFG